MPHGIHKHGRGWRGTLSVSTATYATESEATEALDALRARLNQAPPLRPLPWTHSARPVTTHARAFTSTDRLAPPVSAVGQVARSAGSGYEVLLSPSGPASAFFQPLPYPSVQTALCSSSGLRSYHSVTFAWPVSR
jgi:hypothetical protein